MEWAGLMEWKGWTEQGLEDTPRKGQQWTEKQRLLEGREAKEGLSPSTSSFLFQACEWWWLIFISSRTPWNVLLECWNFPGGGPPPPSCRRECYHRPTSAWPLQCHLMHHHCTQVLHCTSLGLEEHVLGSLDWQAETPEGHPLQIESRVYCDKTGAVHWGNMDCRWPVNKHIVMDCTSPSHSALYQSYKAVGWVLVEYRGNVMASCKTWCCWDKPRLRK